MARNTKGGFVDFSMLMGNVTRGLQLNAPADPQKARTAERWRQATITAPVGLDMCHVTHYSIAYDQDVRRQADARALPDGEGKTVSSRCGKSSRAEA